MSLETDANVFVLLPYHEWGHSPVIFTGEIILANNLSCGKNW